MEFTILRVQRSASSAGSFVPRAFHMLTAGMDPWLDPIDSLENISSTVRVKLRLLETENGFLT